MQSNQEIEISEISKNDLNEIFPYIIQNSGFYEQIGFEDFVKILKEKDNITYENWVTIIDNIRKYRKDSEDLLRLLNFVTSCEYENKKNKIYKLLYEYSTNIPLLKCFKSNKTNLNFSYTEWADKIKQINEMKIYCTKTNENTLLIGGKGKITQDLLKNFTSIAKINIVSSDVGSIEEGAFQNFSKLTSITIPNSVTAIGDRAFDGCISLTSIKIPNSVTSIGECAFLGCSSLASITIPDSVTSIGDAFYGCSSLTNITIPNSVTSIGNEAFSGCSSLETITIPNSVTSIGDSAFEFCSSLTSIIIPKSVTAIGDMTFFDCSKLTNITIPNSVTAIGDHAFDSCSSLKEINIPNSVTSIGDDAFAYCKSLTNITIPNSVKSIGKDTFFDCRSLTSIIIPKSVTVIGSGAFGCSALSLIRIEDQNQIEILKRSLITSKLFDKQPLLTIELPDGRCVEVKSQNEIQNLSTNSFKTVPQKSSVVKQFKPGQNGPMPPSEKAEKNIESPYSF